MSRVDARAPRLDPVARRVEEIAEVEAPRTEPVRILVVADDAAERGRLAAAVGPLGHVVVEAASGTDARRRVARGEFAVIVLDLRGGAAGALDTARFVRSRAESEHTPIVFLAGAERAESDMAVGGAMRAVDFVVAPISAAALRGKVALFADLYVDTRERLDRVEKLARARNDFVARVSHEVRSPLASVIGYVELLRDEVPFGASAEQARMLAIVDRNCRRLLALIEDLLTMSRVDAGTFELEVAPVDVREMAAGVRDTTAPMIAKAGLALTVALHGDLRLTGDRDQLERALLNLVSNAAKFTAPGGRVEIAIRDDADDLVVAIADTGCGIPLEEQRHLFTRFFRSSRSKALQIAGTGLGLYIVKQIVGLHGGEVAVISTPAGSTFTMRIPRDGPPLGPDRARVGRPDADVASRRRSPRGSVRRSG